jgi:hypothetical protein
VLLRPLARRSWRQGTRLRTRQQVQESAPRETPCGSYRHQENGDRYDQRRTQTAVPGDRRGYKRTDYQRQAGYSYGSGSEQRETPNHRWLTSSAISLHVTRLTRMGRSHIESRQGEARHWTPSAPLSPASTPLVSVCTPSGSTRRPPLDARRPGRGQDDTAGSLMDQPERRPRIRARGRPVPQD